MPKWNDSRKTEMTVPDETNRPRTSFYLWNWRGISWRGEVTKALMTYLSTKHNTTILKIKIILYWVSGHSNPLITTFHFEVALSHQHVSDTGVLFSAIWCCISKVWLDSMQKNQSKVEMKRQNRPAGTVSPFTSPERKVQILYIRTKPNLTVKSQKFYLIIQSYSNMMKNLTFVLKQVLVLTKTEFRFESEFSF